MAAWILSALALLRGGAIATGVGTAIETVTGIDIPFIGGFGLGGAEKKKRRRRRRALTASDREDLMFMASFMTKAGIERVAALMVSN